MALNKLTLGRDDNECLGSGWKSLSASPRHATVGIVRSLIIGKHIIFVWLKHWKTKANNLNRKFFLQRNY